jgi:chromosome segregation ATPase
MQAGYFRLDDINAKLKEQVEQAEGLLRQERERSRELEQQCERLRRSGGGGGGLDSEAAAHLANGQEIEQLQEQLRQTERERDQALRRAAGGGASKSDDECFEPTRSGAPDPHFCRYVHASV